MATFSSHFDGVFTCLPAASLQALAYPPGTILFLEGHVARGVFMLCKGRVKLSTSASDGKTVILKIAKPGELLGLSATISGQAYALTAETMEACDIDFVKREDFLRFLHQHTDACFWAAEQLSEKYSGACHELRSLGLRQPAAGKVGRLLLDWSTEHATDKERMNLWLTHEEIAQMIGTSRETVSRIFADLKKQQIVQGHGATFRICNRAALERMVAF